VVGISSDVFMKYPALPPLILHCHVPKTAGVSFTQVLHETFQPFHLHHLHPDPAYVFTPQILETLLEINPLLKSLTSHHLRIFPRRLQNHRPIYITFLREPVAALISLLKYAQREYNNWKPEAQRSWPKDTPRRRLRDLAQAYLDNMGERQQYSYQTCYFCSSLSMERAGLKSGVEYGVDCPDIASHILDQFFFVGITEEMPKSLELLSASFKALGIELRKPPSLHLNRTRTREDLSWLNLDDAVGRRLLRCQPSDEQLYRKFRERFFDIYSRYRKTGVVDVPSDQGPEDQPICEWAARRVLQREKQGQELGSASLESR
jgi:hypothetical protein